MFGFFKKNISEEKKDGIEVVEIKIDGMHCTSCSMNIDGVLEDTDGVLSATTSYAKQISKVEYDPQKISVDKIYAIIRELGYKVAK